MNKNTLNFLTVLGIVVIIGTCGIIFWYVSWDGPIIEYGSLMQDIEYPIGISEPKISLIAVAESASIEVILDDLDGDTLIEINNTVIGPKKLKKNYEEDADQCVVSDDGDGNYTITYTRLSTSLIYRYKHEITISIDSNASLFVDLETFAGNLGVSSDEQNTTMTVQKLLTSGGNIQLRLNEPNATVTLDEIETANGDIEVYFADNSTVYGDLKLTTSNGGIDFYCLNGTNLRLDLFEILVNTGNIEIVLTELYISNNLNFSIVVLYGSLNFNWTQSSITTDHLFVMNINSGDVNIYLDFNPLIGTRYDAETVGGTIDVPPNTTGNGGMGDITFDIYVISGSVNATR